MPGIVQCRPYPHSADDGKFFAGFGQARLVRFLDGRLELHGGSETDRQEAVARLATLFPDVRLGQRTYGRWERLP